MENITSDGVWAKSAASARVLEDSREAFFRILDQGIMPESFVITSNSGKYGNLDVYENGKWGVYTPDPAKISSIALNQEEYDVFEYSYMDEEGNPNNGEVRIEVNYGGSNRVYSTENPIYFEEKYLPRGTQPDLVENVKTGKIYFTEDEHLEYIVISDYGMSRMAFLDMDGTHSSISYNGGLYPYEEDQHHDYFSFEAWKSGPGELSYIARLLEATHFNSTLINGESHTNIDVRCDFRYSDRPNDYRYIPIHIKDDAAYIKDIPLCELGADTSGNTFASGNVADYVVKGADARAITTPQGGELPEVTSWWVDADASQDAFAPYGTLTLSEDGSYYFDFNPQSEAFKALSKGETVSLDIPFQYKECDGETIYGSVPITLKSATLLIAPRPGNVPTSGGDVPEDNPYVPGNPADPDRDITIYDPAADYDPMNPNWGVAKDGQPLMRVFEAGLPNGSEAGQRNVTAHGYLDIDATVGLQSIVATTDGTDSYGFEGDTMAVLLDGGTLTFTKNDAENWLKYEFTLANPVMHEAGNGINSAMQNVKLIATDNFGNAETIGLDVQIIDDVPKPEYDDIQIIECARPAYMYEWRGASPDDMIFPWGFISDKFRGGDPAHSVDSYSIEPLQGQYGKFELSGSYADMMWYTWFDYWVDFEKIESLKSDEIVTESFKYTYADVDGDTAEINAEIVIRGPGVRPNFIINEADLSQGSEILIGGYEIIEPIIYDFTFKHGSISQDQDGIWRYKLSGSIGSDPVQGSNVTHIPNEIYLRVKDPTGFEMIMLTDVDIIDSVPTFTASQNRLAYDFGADNGPGSGLKVAIGGAETDLVPGIETMIAGQHGMLTLSPDGSCHYSPNSDYAGEDIFNFTITDSDGDRALAKVIASVVDGLPQTVISVQTADELAEIEALGVPDGDSGGFIGA